MARGDEFIGPLVKQTLSQIHWPTVFMVSCTLWASTHVHASAPTLEPASKSKGPESQCPVDGSELR